MSGKPEPIQPNNMYGENRSAGFSDNANRDCQQCGGIGDDRKNPIPDDLKRHGKQRDYLEYRPIQEFSRLSSGLFDVHSGLCNADSFGIGFTTLP